MKKLSAWQQFIRRHYRNLSARKGGRNGRKMTHGKVMKELSRQYKKITVSDKRANKPYRQRGALSCFFRNEKDSCPKTLSNGTVEWRNKNKVLHREDGPAIEKANGDKYWYHDGRLHREDDKPAVEMANGDKEWYHNNKRHRENDKPAVERANGDKAWYRNDKRHRENDKPAVERVNGDKYWYRDGKQHREDDKPAVEMANGDKEWWVNGQINKLSTSNMKVWIGPLTLKKEIDFEPYEDFKYENKGYGTGEVLLHDPITNIEYSYPGVVHREDGPAFEFESANGTKEWFIGGLRHREDGPAVEKRNGDKEWYRDARLHRENGPAIEKANGEEEWYHMGIRIPPTGISSLSKIANIGRVGTEYLERIRRMIEREEDVAGVFRQLLFTHNTLYFTFLKMLSGEYSRHIRCCKKYRPIGRGAQFRYGLDSQYGDVIFVMKPERDWWMNKKGVDLDGGIRDEGPMVGRLWSDEIIPYDAGKNERQMEQEALLYTFRDENSRGDGDECKDKTKPLPQLTWCNTQLHLGENISFEHVYKILVPRWLISQPPNFYDDKDKEALDILKMLVNRTYIAKNDDDPLPAIGEKIVLYGPDDINQFYDYIKQDHPCTLKNMSVATCKYYAGYDITNNKITHTTLNKLTASTISISGPSLRDAEKIYMSLLVDSGFVSSGIKVLTYNVYWKAMDSKIDICKGGSCLNQINKFINMDNYDFICLQEATNHTKLQLNIDVAYKDYRSQEEDIATYYNKHKYSHVNTIHGEMEPGRPYMISSFTMKGFEGYVIVMNLHNGHSDTQDSTFINEILKRELSSLSYNPARDLLIIAGDFNRESLNLEYNNSPIMEKISAPSCCTDTTTLAGTHYKTYDHILVQGRGDIIQTRTINLSPGYSDHLPVESIISFK